MYVTGLGTTVKRSSLIKGHQSLPEIAVRKKGVASLAYAGNPWGGRAAWTTGFKPGGDEANKGSTLIYQQLARLLSLTPSLPARYRCRRDRPDGASRSRRNRPCIDRRAPPSA